VSVAGDIPLSAAERADLIRELATIYRSEAAAGPVLDRLLVPPGRRPAWQNLTAEQWWTLFARDLDAGLVAAPYRGLVTIGLLDARYNPVLNRVAARHGLAAGDPPVADPTSAVVPSGGGPGGRGRVFLAHAQQDLPAVREWYERLRADGVPAWLGDRDLRPGEDWDHVVRRVIADSSAFVPFLSAASISKRGYVQKEIVRALDVAERQPEGAVFLIPARLEPCALPDRLSRWHAVDLFEPGGYELLLETLRSLP
jgi:glutathione S-transferase